MYSHSKAETNIATVDFANTKYVQSREGVTIKSLHTTPLTLQNTDPPIMVII